MTPKSLLRLLWVAWLGAACATRGTGLENLTAEQLLERGVARLNDRKWSDAIMAFERFTLQFPTHPRVQ
jgi:outer membrane protein assembly factor BamD (BamD/ComL family)